MTQQDDAIRLQNGRYVLTRLLGSGHFGEVWYGRDFALDMAVAVKLFDMDVDLDPALVQAQATGILLETQVMSRLRASDRIVTIRNVAIEAPLSFIAMDYMRNGSVGARLDAGTVNIADAVRWTREGLDGLVVAHGLGVIHRDIKPDNMLLDDEERALLTDFGLAEDTVRGFFVRTDAYVPHAAPELLNGGVSSVQSDVWAMGCTLYRLLTGEYPFEDLADAAAGNLRDPHTLNPQIPLSLTRVVRTSLAPGPADRYADARAMIDDLIDCGIKNAWVQCVDDATLETWRMETSDESYELTMTTRKDGRIHVCVKRDLGSGPRSLFKQDFGTVGRARQARRRLLVQGVEGKALS